MSDSSDEEWSYNFMPYSLRAEWNDVTPIEQDDGENPIVAIAYSKKFREVFDYFRAILASKEKSLRALQLTKDAIDLNAANYTVWQYRRDILRELNCDLNEELDYTEDVIRDNAKNYQVWHHRRVIVEALNDASKELQLTEMALQTDAKNYHVWQHRQWAIRKFNLYDDELTFVDRLIAEDIRNNSAWNQRFFVIKHNGFTAEVIRREMHYAMNRIRVVKNNESAWNYLRGVLRQSDDGMRLYQNAEVVDFCNELYDAGVRSPYLLAFLIDLYEEECIGSECKIDRRKMLSQKVYALCDDLAKKHDIIRRKYWKYVAEQLNRKLAETQI